MKIGQTVNVQTHFLVWLRAVALLRSEDAGWDSDFPQPPVFSRQARWSGWGGVFLLTPSVTDQTGQIKMASVGDGADVALP